MVGLEMLERMSLLNVQRHLVLRRLHGRDKESRRGHVQIKSSQVLDVKAKTTWSHDPIARERADNDAALMHEYWKTTSNFFATSR
jgi:hypothetical protein